MKSPVYCGTAFDHQVRFYLADISNLSKDKQKQLSLPPLSLKALMLSMGITGIMGLMEKSPVKILTVVNGDGEFGKIYAKANNKGEVKGFVQNPYADIQPRPEVDPLAAGVGKIGNIEVTKDFGLKTPFFSETSIIAGNLLADYSYYFAYSEQTPTAISGTVMFNQDLSVECGALLLVQVMPNCDEEIINNLEKKITKFTQLIPELKSQGKDVVLSQIFDQNFHIFEEKELQLTCDCSYERFLTNINLLPLSDRQELAASKEAIEASCDWCNQKYVINQKDINIK